MTSNIFFCPALSGWTSDDVARLDDGMLELPRSLDQTDRTVSIRGEDSVVKSQGSLIETLYEGVGGCCVRGAE